MIRENENVLVEFFAPWCPACVTFLPHLETLKNSNTDLPLTVVKVFDDGDSVKIFDNDGIEARDILRAENELASKRSKELEEEVSYLFF